MLPKGRASAAAAQPDAAHAIANSPAAQLRRFEMIARPLDCQLKQEIVAQKAKRVSERMRWD
jgi:hypothetical protein